MNVVSISSKLFKGDLVSVCDFLSDFPNCAADGFAQQGFAIFHRKDDMVVRIIDAVVGVIEAHAFIIYENRGFSYFPTRPRVASHGEKSFYIFNSHSF